MRGKAHLKEQVARRIALDVEHLPYRQDVIEFLRQHKAAGRKLILATAASQRHAKQVAEHLHLFERVEASDATVNLEGGHKLARLKELSKGGVFDYCADDLADLAIFPHARRIIVVAPPPTLHRALKKMANIERIFEPDSRTLASLLAALRPVRWPMNLLVLLPLLWPMGAGDAPWLEACLGAIAFSLAASGNYLYDDLLHLPERRRLPADKRGAIAAGGVALQRAGMAIAVLWLLAFAFTLMLPGFFALAMLGYIALSILAVQDWYRPPRLLTAMALAVGRVAAGATLVTQPVPAVLWLAALAAGAGGEVLRRRKIGFI